MSLVVIIFTLAMGFNFVALFNYYITIFYIFGGNEVTAGRLLGINGTAWAITGLVAVFPLNWLSKNLGKNHTLLISILLMCAAQLSKIVCYNPAHPYLLLIPTILLSSGMLMFFTLGSSMVGDICDEDELKTGTRSEGSFYAVFWWFIKMGSAFASFVTGVLLVFTTFDEQQNVSVDALSGSVAAIKADFEAGAGASKLPERLDKTTELVDKLRQHLEARLAAYPDQADHIGLLIERAAAVRAEAATLRAKNSSCSRCPRGSDARRRFIARENGTPQATVAKHAAPLESRRNRLAAAAKRRFSLPDASLSINRSTLLRNQSRAKSRDTPRLPPSILRVAEFARIG